MQQSDETEHTGSIEKIEPGKLFIRIEKQSACSACSVKGKCPLPESKEELITIDIENAGSYKVGDEITVCLKTSLGLRAVLIAYIVPFIILMMVLIGVFAFTGNEPVAGISALCSLVPYYLLLFLLRKKSVKKFQLKVISRES
jgi:sigma-E factor negative regulatory protein RseC